MINRDIEKITKEDLQALVDNEVIEHKTIEYKQTLPGNSDSNKKEFLADVSSFANASGGDIVYGITEDKKTGKPKSLDGLDVENVDQERLRLDNIIRTGIQPRLPSVTISPPIPLKNSKVALIVRVPKSWSSPHRVTFGGHNEFYSRRSNGKQPLDVGELRIAFNLSETTIERIRNFKLDRISKIFANETPVPFYETAKIVLHLIPIISFNPGQAYDIGKIASHPGTMLPIYTNGGTPRYNLDGFLTYCRDTKGKSFSYAQLYRNGIIEAVEGLLLEPSNGRLIIPSVAYEEGLIRSLTEYLSLLKMLNVELPVFVFLTLLGVKGYSLGVSRERFDISEFYPIDRDILQLPEVILESYDVNAAKELKPCFDAIWNSCGFRKSFNYNDAGEWAPR